MGHGNRTGLRLSRTSSRIHAAASAEAAYPPACRSHAMHRESVTHGNVRRFAGKFFTFFPFLFILLLFSYLVIRHASVDLRNDMRYLCTSRSNSGMLCGGCRSFHSWNCRKGSERFELFPKLFYLTY